VTSWLRPVLGVLLATGALTGAALLSTAPAASAATPCWKTLLNDWYDGRIDHTYPISCYHAAIKHLPTDVQTYSSAKDDIDRALQAALQADRRKHVTPSEDSLVPPQTTTGTPSGAGGGDGSSGGGGTGAGGSGTTTVPSQATSLPGNRDKRGLSRLADDLNPSSPSSLPLPLLVLGGLALLLVAAGAAGLVLKRRQDGP
jgi:hypothetical protein